MGKNYKKLHKKGDRLSNWHNRMNLFISGINRFIFLGMNTENNGIINYPKMWKGIVLCFVNHIN